MNTKTQNTTGTYQNIATRTHSLIEKVHPRIIQPLYRPLYFTVTSNVDESFIVDWQLDDK